MLFYYYTIQNFLFIIILVPSFKIPEIIFKYIKKIRSDTYAFYVLKVQCKEICEMHL
jgi:hypothetical protein